MNLFGFSIIKKTEEEERLESFVPANLDDGSIEIADGSGYSTYIDFENKTKHEGELISRYREMSIQAEMDLAIQDIINEAIVVSKDGDILEINTDKLQYSNQIKQKIKNEFDNILKMLNFNDRAYDMFRKFYVDGRLYYNIVVDIEKPLEGIKELRYIDPRRIRKIKKTIRKKDPTTGVMLYLGSKEYYLYNAQGIYNNDINTAAAGVMTSFPVASDTVAFIHSGLMDPKGSTIYSHLHKAIKPLNQLAVLEDATVIYRLVRAPERRIFSIDVGSLQKGKAEQYVRDMMTKNKNKLVYDASTGKVKDDRRFMTMLEDYWFPRREGGRGTEVTTLAGGQNLGQIEDVEYFKSKFYKSLNVPMSRLQNESTFNLGRASEITRDEVKFSKFINRLRNDFTEIIDFMLEIQLSLKGIINRNEWKKIKQEISYSFQDDNQFTELKEVDILRERLSLLDNVDAYVGKYFSTEWVRKNVLRQTEEDIKEIDKQIVENGDNELDEDEAPAKPIEKSEPPAAPEPPAVTVSPEAAETQSSPPGPKKPSKPVKANEEIFYEEDTVIEEKALIESMTRFMDTMTTDENN